MCKYRLLTTTCTSVDYYNHPIQSDFAATFCRIYFCGSRGFHVSISQTVGCSPRSSGSTGCMLGIVMLKNQTSRSALANVDLKFTSLGGPHSVSSESNIKTLLIAQVRNRPTPRSAVLPTSLLQASAGVPGRVSNSHRNFLRLHVLTTL